MWFVPVFSVIGSVFGGAATTAATVGDYFTPKASVLGLAEHRL